jgi:hypothetical protein
MKEEIRSAEKRAAQEAQANRNLLGRIDKMQADLCSVSHAINTMHHLASSQVPVKSPPVSGAVADSTPQLPGTWHGCAPNIALRIRFDLVTDGRHPSGNGCLSLGNQSETFSWNLSGAGLRLATDKGEFNLQASTAEVPPSHRHVRGGTYHAANLCLRGRLPLLGGDQENHFVRFGSVESRAT